MKCDFCGSEIGESFLGKIRGAYVKIDEKRKAVCSDCQRKYKGRLKEEI